MGLLINRQAGVTLLECKQTRQYGPDPNIDDSSKVRNVDDCCSLLLSEKTDLALSLLGISESGDDNAKLSEARCYVLTLVTASIECSLFHRRGSRLDSSGLQDAKQIGLMGKVIHR